MGISKKLIKEFSSIRKEYDSLKDLSGIERKNAITEFKNKHNVEQFGVTNYDERMRNTGTDISFGKGQDYWGIKNSEGTYFGLINPNRQYEQMLHGVGGGKEIYTSKYDGGSFNKVRIDSPAIFSIDNSGIELKEQGKALFGNERYTPIPKDVSTSIPKSTSAPASAPKPELNNKVIEPEIIGKEIESEKIINAEIVDKKISKQKNTDKPDDNISKRIEETVKKKEKINEKPEQNVGSQKKSNDFESWLKDKYSKQQEQLNNMAAKGEDELKSAAKRLGVDDETIKKSSFEDLQKIVRETNANKTMNHISNPNLIDKMLYHKIPEKALGTAVTLGVIHSMMNGGQQSNSQLYNQQDVNGQNM